MKNNFLLQTDMLFNCMDFLSVGLYKLKFNKN